MHIVISILGLLGAGLFWWYRLRAAGAAVRDVADMALSGIEKFGQKMAQARRWWDAQTRGEAPPAAGDRDIPGVIKEVNEARRALKTAIAEKLEASEDEQRRVAAILQKAAEDIRKPTATPKPTDDIDLG